MTTSTALDTQDICGAVACHRLEGLESDNLLAFLALLGLMRALEAEDRNRVTDDRIQPRAGWDVDAPPIRPVLVLGMPLSRTEVLERAALGLDQLANDHEFGGRKGLDYTSGECRALIAAEAERASSQQRGRADLMAALMSDAAVRDEKTFAIAPTPLCLLFGQGHQHFLERLADVPRSPAPPPRGRRGQGALSASDCLDEALFHPWHRADPTVSFRWDPEEDVRYAMLAGDPTVAANKQGTQHGANRLATAGLASLTAAPVVSGGRVRLRIPGGAYGTGGFSFAWPVWRDPATLAAIRALLGSPSLREHGALSRFSVQWIYVAHRISVGKFMNFSRGRLLAPPGTGGP